MAIIDDYEDIASRMKGELKSKPDYQTAEISQSDGFEAYNVGFIPGRPRSPPPPLSPYRCTHCKDTGHVPFFEFVANGQLVNSWRTCTSCCNSSRRLKPQVIRIDCTPCLDAGWQFGVECPDCKNPMGLPQP